MPVRFFFDLVCGDELIRDTEGVEAKDLEQALAEARSIVAELADDVNTSSRSRSWIMVVRNDAGSVVGSIEIK